jgi:thiamine-phosphate pyrophosphorylase
MFSFPSTLYAITDVEISGLSHAEQVTRLIAGGATLIQLRDKYSSPRQFFRDAEEALVVARLHGVRIIINDRVDIALALRADGVHLGQSDLPPDAARKLLGDTAVIGFSVHSVEQARTAARLSIDYLGIGPVFPTSTKENPDPVIGVEELHRAREAAGEIPLVAIGGITLDNASRVLETGADAIALISALLENPLEITARTADAIRLQ